MVARRQINGRSIRWDEALATRAYAEGWWTRETLADALARAAQETPARVLLIEGDRSLDCATLHAQAHALARALLARLEPGATISFMLPNWLEAATLYLGITLAGMVAHPVLPALRHADLGFVLRDVGSRMIFIPDQYRGHDYPAMLASLTDAPEVVIVRGERDRFAALLSEADDRPLPALDADAVRMILTTSGTTGTPKGVMHSHNSLHALSRQIGAHWLVAPGDRFLVPSPLSHIAGSIYSFELPLLLGTSAVLMDRWSAEEAVALIDGVRCTHVAAATVFLDQMLAVAKARGTCLPALKLFVCGGASVPPALIEEAADWFAGAAVTRVYGSTEVPVITVGVTDGSAAAAHSDGQPGIAEVRIVADEIRAKGPQMLVGYVQPEVEAEVFDADGFYRTGDLGHWQTGGFLEVTGRAKDIIIRNGENIAPKEVEDLLRAHPAIADVAIIGLPHPRTGEQACAVVIPAEGAEPTLEAIGAWLAKKGLAAFKRPEALVLRADLPRNVTGKVLKAQLRTELGA